MSDILEVWMLEINYNIDNEMDTVVYSFIF